jgi:hypothetical protein
MLGGCVTVQVTPQPVCLPQVAYTPTQEKAMGDALAALEASNPLVPFVTDAIAMRRANQAVCNSNKGTTK